MNKEEISKLSYKQAVEKLETIVSRMQSPECDIDLLAEYTSESLALLNHCKEKLRKTDEDVKRCLESIG